MLNSQMENEVGGYLSPVELNALSKAIDDANISRRHLLIALHHPPNALGCAWLDSQRLINAHAFFTEVSRCKQSTLVISGHVHQNSDHEVEGVRYLTTPSTCIQFKPRQKNFCVDDISPGYRWLKLHPNGNVDTAIERVTDQKFPVDLNSSGYL